MRRASPPIGHDLADAVATLRSCGVPRTRDQLLDELNRLQPPAFEEVVFRLNLPKQHIASSEAARSVRAIAVVETLEQSGRLGELETRLLMTAAAATSLVPSQPQGAASPSSGLPSGDSVRGRPPGHGERRVAGWPLVVLHISDLHFGPNGRFKGEDPKVVARRFVQAIDEARTDLQFTERVGLIIVTGDIAEAARPREYAEALAFFNGLVGGLGLPARRVVFVPGNHDVSWPETRKVEQDADVEGFDYAELRRRAHAVKLKHFEKFLVDFYGHPRDRVDGLQSIGHGAFVYSDSEHRWAVAALNTCEREWHKEQGGFLGESQARALMGQWRQPEVRDGWVKIIALHHNPVATVPANVQSWTEYLRQQADKKAVAKETIDHFIADVVALDGHDRLRAVANDCRVQLILHGHHHAADHNAWTWTSTKGQTLVLSSGSWGLRADKLPDGQPAMMHLVRIDPERELAHSVLRVYEPRARAESEVTEGHFVVDAACPRGRELLLVRPERFIDPSRDTSTGAAGGAAASQAKDFVAEYRRLQASQYQRWELRGIGAVQPLGSGRPIDTQLDDMYQPLRVAAGYDIRKFNRGKPLPPEELFGRGRPLVIRGVAGSGKTTWMRWTFRRLLEIDGALPLFVELRAVAQAWTKRDLHGSDRTINAYLEEWIAESGVSGWREALPAVLAATSGPRPVLLVDGWDELGDLGEELRTKLEAFRRKHPRVLVVVTSRPYGEARPSHVEGFDELDIQPLSDEEVAAFAGRFHRIIHGDDDAAVHAADARFGSALAASPEARALGRTALLLTMMLFVSRDRALPDKRHKLYEDCLRNLLTARVEQREREGAQLDARQWRPHDSEERLRVVSMLALGMQDWGYRKERRSQILDTWYGMEAYLPDSWRQEDRRGFLVWLVASAGVLVDRSDGKLMFAHLSFQEYLTAYRLAATAEGEEARIELCRARMNNADWWETLRLWAAIVEDRNPEHLQPVLEALCSEDATSFWLAGAMFADGPGETVFPSWVESFDRRFHVNDEPWSAVCANAWAGSRQRERRAVISALWMRYLQRWNWLQCIAAERWRRAARIKVTPSSENAWERINDCDSQIGIARSRVQSASSPIWPGIFEIVLLRLWPGFRPITSQRIQMTISLGATKDEVHRVSDILLLRSSGSNDSSRDTARALMRHWGPFLFMNLPSRTARNFARDHARELARHLLPDIAFDNVQIFAPYLERVFSRNQMRFWTRWGARHRE